ncbi:MAG: phosphoglycerate dehydrogenase [Acidobacteria bacterium]|nr:phosphoglycerate dehydrogenase [Acidobacteriota bacterium]
MKILVTDKIADRGLELLRAEGWQVEPVSPKEAEAVRRGLAEATAWILRSGTQVTAELLEAAPRLKVIGRAGVGVDNIDLEAATRRGILVMNTPGGNAVSVAEHTFALLLALARRVPEADRSTRSGEWRKSEFAGFELKGKTLGLVGLGRIGQEVGRRAQAFEMTVLAHDPFVAAALARDLGVELVSLDELLARADFLSLHVTLTPETERLLNRERLARCKRGMRILNTARGELVDDAALAEALASGQVAGAALDVFSSEPPKDSPLLKLPNVIATPHIGGSTAEAQEEVGWRIAQQVRDYLKDGVVRNAVNLPTLSAEEYRRLKPYLELAERLGAFAVQVAGPMARVSLRYAGEVGELNTHLLRNAVLKGILGRVVDEPANLVSAATLAAERGLTVDETYVRREQGFPDTLGVTVHATAQQFSVEGTVLHGAALRILAVDEIDIEAPLEGTLIFMRNRDVPGVIGQVGTILGSRNINIASFALGRREQSGSMGSLGPGGGAEAVALVRVDGAVPETVLQALRSIPAVTFAQVVEL